MNSTDLCFLSATELQHLIRDHEVSARELTEAHLAQIDRVNPRLNAIVTLLADQALEQASAADEALLRGHQLGPLHGLPVAHKDMAETKGIRTTFGSPTLSGSRARSRCIDRGAFESSGGYYNRKNQHS